ncbi:MAG: hydroxymethylbilane synthase, partial [Flavobacteriaceae bacterium]|nr:hydroxymethylbilane synthase [Flavobacteriaceae bacterium]
MKPKLRIGTRDSALALWQANFVQKALHKLGVDAELVPVKSEGDIELEKPLYEMGITGIFTKTLDVALLNEDIDLAVHSMKDVPTRLPDGIVEAAVLKRASNKDVLIYKGQNPMQLHQATIATGSLRRKAQWLHRFKAHQVVNLRGNIQTRLKKLEDQAWNAAIFAEAGLDRANLKPDNHLILDWMYPAPAQGAMLVVCRKNQPDVLKLLAQLNHHKTAACVTAERSFLRHLEGG